MFFLTENTSVTCQKELVFPFQSAKRISQVHERLLCQRLVRRNIVKRVTFACWQLTLGSSSPI